MNPPFWLFKFLENSGFWVKSVPSSTFAMLQQLAFAVSAEVTFYTRRDAEIALRMQYRAHGMQPHGQGVGDPMGNGWESTDLLMGTS